MKKLAKLEEKIKEITSKHTYPLATYCVEDSSTNAELRLNCTWAIRHAHDAIHYPKAIDNPWPLPAPWLQLSCLEQDIQALTHLDHKASLRLSLNARTKKGDAERQTAELAFRIEQGKDFMRTYRKAVSQSEKIRKRLTSLNAKISGLLPAMRAYNSAIMLARRTAAADRRAANHEALTSGRFWDADKEALKGYFHPPFEKNYLADVSEKWRAALYTEMESTAWKDWNGNWRHKNTGTGRGYLCGIDDNGDEWGHHVDLRGYLERDQYDDYGYVASVEDAMSSLFELPVSKLANCERQGDLLFCRESIPAGVDLTEQPYPWEIRESHTLTSEGLQRNGRYFRSAAPILVSHTSHAAISLPAGDYRLYAIAIADAD